MSRKFYKNRSVEVGYCKIPLYYTSVRHPNNQHKQLVVMDRIGGNYTVCWRNNKTNKTGIEHLEKAIESNDKFGFMFKDKFVDLRKSSRVW